MQNKTKILSWFFWIIIWQISAIIIDLPIFLPYPHIVLQSFFNLLTKNTFWLSIFFTIKNILTGFSLGVLFSTILAILSNKFKLIDDLLKPLMLSIKTIPVASFIILVLLWFSSSDLSVVISFMMVLPVIYTNTLQGIKSTDNELIEMSKVFNFSLIKKLKYVYLFQVYPYFKSGVLIALGLAFKSGIAAEVIGLPKNSIGEQIYNAKIYINTVDLFAWTLVVVLLSLIFEKSITWLFDKIINLAERT